MGLPWWVDPGYFSVGCLLILPVFNTFQHVLSMKSVGGGTRVEPFVASLLSYTCSSILAAFDNSWSFHKLWVDESAWINGISMCIYFLYLCLFLHFAEDSTVRQTTLREYVPVAVSYVAVMTMVGVLTESTVPVKWLCMVAGVISSGTPHVLSWFVMDKYVENLPDWMSSAVELLHYGVWIFRETDFFDLVQNGSGALSSLAFLLMLFIWRNWKAPAPGEVAEVRQPLLDIQEVVIKPAAAGGLASTAAGSPPTAASRGQPAAPGGPASTAAGSPPTAASQGQPAAPGGPASTAAGSPPTAASQGQPAAPGGPASTVAGSPPTAASQGQPAAPGGPASTAAGSPPTAASQGQPAAPGGPASTAAGSPPTAASQGQPAAPGGPASTAAGNPPTAASQGQPAAPGGPASTAAGSPPTAASQGQPAAPGGPASTAAGSPPTAASRGQRAAGARAGVLVSRNPKECGGSGSQARGFVVN